MRFASFLIAAAAIAVAAPAAAADFSFSGTLGDPNDELFFDFTVGTSSLVTLRTYSYAGGTNAAGQTIARGGFDPILALFDKTSGVRIGTNDDDQTGTVPADINGLAYDTFFQATLAAGSYTVAVSLFPNFSVGPNLSDGFENDAVDFGGRSQQFAFDVLNVDTATGPGGAVPEPATWAMMIGGLGVAGGALRRRRARVSTRVAFA